jgi:oligopeptide transport system substrate-binding protein
MGHSPKRTQLFERTVRQFDADTPWWLGVMPCRNMLGQRRVIGYKAHPVLFGEWICVDIEAKVC